MNEKLPTFERPPVSEVAMGVQFAPLTKLLASHVGKFWSIFEADYPQCTENPPIAPQIENFDLPGAVQPPRLKLSQTPDIPRVFLVDTSGQWLIQVQRDRFLHNWREITEETEYPRYPEVKRRFFEQWDRFQAFIERNELGPIQITQLEITYLNRILVPSSRMGDVFPDFQWRDETRPLRSPESMQISCSFKSPEKPKRLRVHVRPTIQQGQQEMRLELTARGSLHNEESPSDWFDQGRSWIVEAFCDLTSAEWHSKWGEK